MSDLLKRALEAWSSPSDFQLKFDAINEQVNSSGYFNSTKIKFLRDAWVLAVFGRLVKADAVRLSGKDFPDGYARISGVCHEIEITEADRPRERGREYKHVDEYTVCPAPINDAEDVAGALEEAFQRKTEKKYASRPILVVNLNLGVHGRHEQETRLQSMIAAMKEKYAARFETIYVLQSGKLV